MGHTQNLSAPLSTSQDLSVLVSKFLTAEPERFPTALARS